MFEFHWSFHPQFLSVTFFSFQASETRQTFHRIRQIVGLTDSINTSDCLTLLLVLSDLQYTTPHVYCIENATHCSVCISFIHCFSFSRLLCVLIFAVLQLQSSQYLNPIDACLMCFYMCKLLKKNIDTFTFSASCLKYF